MKRAVCFILTCLLILPAMSSALPGGFVRSQETGTNGVLTETGARNALSVLLCETSASEDTDEVETKLILENTGWQTVSVSWKLPRLSAGIRKGSLSLSSSGGVLRTSEDEVYLTFAPKETLTLSYQYRTKDPLVHARVIGMDLRSLVFGDAGRIGRFSIQITLREETVPLVEEIFPACYTLNETTVGVELWNVKPSSLLDRFYLSKETYRNLKGHQDHTPNAAQQFILDHYREWFQNGLTFSEKTQFNNNAMVLHALRNPDQPQRWSEKIQAQFESLSEGTDAYLQIFQYLCAREGHWLYGIAAWPLTLERERQEQAPDELHVIAVGYCSDPAVREALHYVHMDDAGNVREKDLKEEALLTVEPVGWRSIRIQPESRCTFRIAKIGFGQSYDAETLQEYLDAIGAEAFVKQMILNALENTLDDYQDTGYTGTNYAAASYGNVTADDLRAAFPKSPLRWTLLAQIREDPLLSALKVPAFVHYVAVLAKDGLWVAEYAGCYGIEYGAPYYARVAESEAGQALLVPTKARRQTARETVENRIAAASGAKLTAAPFHETGNETALRVLECSLRIREETSTVRTELRIKNDGEQDVLTCLELPVLRNAVKKGSFTVTDASAGSPVAGGGLYVKIAPQEVLSVSYAYETSVSLMNAGAIGMDFSGLQFCPGERVGHVGVSLELTPESVPLVTELFPVNYEFDGTTVSWDLWDFQPNALLNRFYLTKETYRNLNGSRDYDLNEVERHVLKRIRKWFRTGLPEPNEKDVREYGEIRAVLMAEGFRFDETSRLTDHTDTLAAVLNHLILSAEIAEGTLTAEKIRSVYSGGYDYSGRYYQIRYVPLLTRELLKQIAYPEPPVVVAVEYVSEPSLKDVPLYKAHFEWLPGQSMETVRLDPTTEFRVLASKPDRSMIIYPIESENVRVAVFSEQGSFTDDDLREYLDAIGASVLLRSALLNDLDGSLNAYRRPDPDADRFLYRTMAFSAPEDGAVSPDDLIRLFEGEEVLVVTDEKAEADPFGIPVFTQYFGSVIDYEGYARVMPYDGGGIFGSLWRNALYRMDEILALDRVQALLNARRSQSETRKKAVQEELSLSGKE